jgi:hypothetical protein
MNLQHLLQGSGVGLPLGRSRPHSAALALIGLHILITSCLLLMLLLKVC